MITMRTRWIAICLGTVLLGVPLGVYLLEDPLTVADNIMYVASALLILSLSVAGWRMKRRLKERMRRGLGRDVADYELTSITTWMRIPDQAARAGREAEKFDFDSSDV